MFYEEMNNMFRDFTREIGERKFNKIKMKIQESKKVNEAINESLRRNLPLGSDDFVDITLGIPFFAFARKETIWLGIMNFVMYWDSKCNSNNQLRSENEMMGLLEIIRMKMSNM